MNRSEKAVAIEAIKARANKASIAVVTDFKGMPVEEMTRLRVKLRENNAELCVVKNTLAKLALDDGPHEVIKDNFKENCAIALGHDDPVAVAKVLSDFLKTSKTLQLRHGSLEGKFLDKSQLEALSKLPSRPELLAHMLGTMNAVPTNFVSLFANMIRGMLYALKAIEEKKSDA